MVSCFIIYEVFECQYIPYRLEVRYKVIVEPFSNDFSNKSFTEIADRTIEILENSTFENFNLAWTNVTESRMESGNFFHYILKRYKKKNPHKKLNKQRSNICYMLQNLYCSYQARLTLHNVMHDN